MLIDIHTHNPKTADGVFAPRSFAIHPWDLTEASPQQVALLLATMEIEVRRPSTILVGECGLDRCRGDLNLQQDIFLRQLKIAETVCKPVLVHCVHANDLLLSLRKSYCWQQPWVVHGFTGSAQLAQQFMNVGILCSFGTALLDPHRTKPRQAIQALGVGHFFLETDTSNCPIGNIYLQTAQILSISITQLESAIEKAFTKLTISQIQH